ncbi:MAG: twin transmembrane helix small protein [Rhodobacteraceae bacterium]|nr:twin transmembrane helix small protein [Paracoccaceae bacterium]
MDDPLFVLVVIACLAVVVVLVIGIGGFGKGGEFNQKYANKLMRLRLLTQGIAVALIALYVYLRQGGM